MNKDDFDEKDDRAAISSSRKVSVIVPMFNEEENVENIILQITTVLLPHSGIPVLLLRLPRQRPKRPANVGEKII